MLQLSPKFRYSLPILLVVAFLGFAIWLPTSRAPARTSAPSAAEVPEVPTTAAEELEVASVPADTAESAGDADGRRTVAERVQLLRGRVVDLISGEAVPAAFFHSGRPGARPQPIDAGVFELELDDRRRLRFEVRAPGFCTLAGHLDVAAFAAEETVVFPLLPGVSVDGRVTDIDAEPVSGALVRRLVSTDHVSLAHPDLPDGWVFRSSGGNVSSASDGEGRFRTVGLLPGTSLHFEAEHPRFEPRTHAWTAAESGVSAEFEIVLERRFEAGCGEIVGQVLIDGQAQPAQVWWRSGSDWLPGRSKEKGSFRLIGVPAGLVDLRFAPLDWLEVPGEQPLPGGAATVAVVAGERTWYELHLQLVLGTLVGRAVYADGSPAAELSVGAVTPGKGHTVQARTDAKGAFRLEVALLGKPYRLTLGRGSGEVGFAVFPGSSGVDYVVPRMSFLDIRVSDAEDGAVLERFNLRLQHGSFSQRSPIHDEIQEDGYRRYHLPVGRLEFMISAAGHEWEWHGVDVLLDGGSRLEVKLNRRPLPDGLQLRGND